MMRLDRKAGTCTSACGEGSSACGVTTARAARARESAQCGLGLSSSGELFGMMLRRNFSS